MLIAWILAGLSQVAAPDEDAARCAACHPSQVATFARTGMARALEPLRAGELAGLAPVDEPDTGFRYAFEGDGPGARLVESFARAGAPPWRSSAPVAMAVGAGELDRSYLVRRGSRLWFAPLEVLGHGEGRHAALAPGHAMQPGTRFDEPVTPECLGCHTDAPPARTWPLNHVPPDWTPRGISCAACHGGLAEHVRARETSTPDPLAESGWSRVQRMERCAACHLQGDARIELDGARLGPPPPGTPLLASRAVFVARAADDAVGFVSHVQRLVLSPCYLRSGDFPGGGLSCESCHDPHRSFAEPSERAQVRAACHACHEPTAEVARRAHDCALAPAERPAGRDCVDCHMRTTGVFDVAEVQIHDHWIRRDPPPASAPAPLRFFESPGGDWRLFAWPDAPEEETPDAGLWTLALYRAGLHDRALEQARSGIGVRARELPMLHHVRGSLFERAGDWSAARTSYELAITLDPELAESKINLAPVLVQLGQGEAGRALLDELVSRYPLADTAYRNRAAVRLALGDPAGFRADMEAAMKLRPDPALARALARYCEQAGDTAGRELWEGTARALDPRTPDAGR